MIRKYKQDGKYLWTFHVRDKMKFYNISEGRIKRIIRHPKRIEDGVAPKTLAAMQPSDSKKYQEIWVMWQEVSKPKSKSKKLIIGDRGSVKIISAWRYPGKSPARNPIPQSILDEIRNLF